MWVCPHPHADWYLLMESFKLMNKWFWILPFMLSPYTQFNLLTNYIYIHYGIIINYNMAQLSLTLLYFLFLFSIFIAFAYNQMYLHNSFQVYTNICYTFIFSFSSRFPDPDLRQVQIQQFFDTIPSKAGQQFSLWRK